MCLLGKGFSPDTLHCSLFGMFHTGDLSLEMQISILPTEGAGAGHPREPEASLPSLL